MKPLSSFPSIKYLSLFATIKELL